MSDLLDKVLASTNQLKEQLLEAVEKLQTSKVYCEKKPFFWSPKSVVGVKRDRRPDRGKSSKKMKSPKWTHTFVCLSKKDHDMVPDSDERSTLQMAGLGEKRIALLIDADSGEIYNELHFHFPKLKHGGGFEMLRLAECGGKMLQVLAVPTNGYTVPYLRAVVHNAKIYLRPLQKNLDTDPALNEPSTSSPPRETCLSCGTLLYVTMIREHMEICCNKTETISESTPDESTSDSVPICQPDLSPITLSDSDSDDATLQMALKISKEEFIRQESSLKSDTGDESKSIGDIVKNLKKEVSSSVFDMVIRRGFVLVDTLRRTNKITFDPTKAINVEFVGEVGIDTGGLTREYFRLLFQQFSDRYMECTGCFKHNAVAFQDNVYFRLGQLASMCLIQGGAAIRIFCPSVFSLLCGMNPSDIVAQIEEIPDKEVQDIMNKIVAVQDVQELISLLHSCYDIIVESGFTKPLSYAKLEDKTSIVQTVTLSGS